MNLSSFGRSFFGEGDGTFQINPSFLTAPNPTKLALVDFDQDGLSDVAAVTSTGLQFFATQENAQLSPVADFLQPNLTDVTAINEEGELPAIAAVSSDGLLFFLEESLLKL